MTGVSRGILSTMSDQDESEPTDCISGPVETRGDLLVLRIPLAAGADKFVPVTTAIGSVDGDVLEIRIPVFIAQTLGIGAGDRVTVGLQAGKFTIWPS
jgi:hypothetical protein